MKNTTEQKIVKISDLVKTTRGFHRIDTSKSDAYSLLRSQKTDTITSAKNNVQKGDYVVFAVYSDIGIRDIFNPIQEAVWEVSFVSSIPNSALPNGFSQVSLSLARVPNAIFHPGEISTKFKDDCIIFQ